jgi:hypothetical protein
VAKLLKNGELSEYAIHTTVVEWCHNHPKLRKCILHIPNEGKRDAKNGWHLNRMGLRKGASDLFIAWPRHQYSGAWIELKTKIGKASSEQLSFLQDMSEMGYFTAITKGLDEALITIEKYCFGNP